MSCEEPQYWKAKLADLGVEAKGNRYHLRAIYRRLVASLPVAEEVQDEPEAEEEVDDESEEEAEEVVGEAEEEEEAVAPGFATGPLSEEVEIEVLGTILRFGYVTSVAARAMCCVSKRWRDLVRAAVAALIAEKTNFSAQLSLVLPSTYRVFLLVTGPNREVHAAALDTSAITVGRKRCDIVVSHTTVSITHLEITPVLTRPEWRVQIRGRHGALHIRAGLTSPLQTNEEVYAEVGDEFRIPRRVPIYTLQIVRS